MLTKKTQLIGFGNFDYDKGCDCKFRKDELGDLNDSFKQMTENLKKYYSFKKCTRTRGY